MYQPVTHEGRCWSKKTNEWISTGRDGKPLRVTVVPCEICGDTMGPFYGEHGHVYCSQHRPESFR